MAHTTRVQGTSGDRQQTCEERADARPPDLDPCATTVDAQGLGLERQQSSKESCVSYRVPRLAPLAGPAPVPAAPLLLDRFCAAMTSVSGSPRRPQCRRASLRRPRMLML